MLLSLLHDNHSSSIAQEYGLSTWNETSEEALDALRLVDELCSLARGVSDALCLGLCQVFEDLKWPDQEPGDVRGTT